MEVMMEKPKEPVSVQYPMLNTHTANAVSPDIAKIINTNDITRQENYGTGYVVGNKPIEATRIPRKPIEIEQTITEPRPTPQRQQHHQQPQIQQPRPQFAEHKKDDEELEWNIEDHINNSVPESKFTKFKAWMKEHVKKPNVGNPITKFKMWRAERKATEFTLWKEEEPEEIAIEPRAKPIQHSVPSTSPELTIYESITEGINSALPVAILKQRGLSNAMLLSGDVDLAHLEERHYSIYDLTNLVTDGNEFLQMVKGKSYLGRHWLVSDISRAYNIPLVDVCNTLELNVKELAQHRLTLASMVDLGITSRHLLDPYYGFDFVTINSMGVTVEQLRAYLRMSFEDFRTLADTLTSDQKQLLIMRNKWTRETISKQFGVHIDIVKQVWPVYQFINSSNRHLI